MSRPRAKKKKYEEARLDQTIRDVLGKGPEDYPPLQWRSLRESCRHWLYPGFYVAFLDHHEHDGDVRRLARREILCTSCSLQALNRRLDRILKTRPSEVQYRVGISYLEPPETLPRVSNAGVLPAQQ
jgi:hypothetical protein